MGTIDQAKWGNEVWGISSHATKPLASFTVSFAVKSKPGKDGFVKLGQECVKISLDYIAARALNAQPEKEAERLESLIGSTDALYIGGEYLGYFIFTGFEPTDCTLDAVGNMTKARFSLKFIEKSETGTKIDGLKILYKGKEIQDKITVSRCVLKKYAQERTNELCLTINDPDGDILKWHIDEESIIEIESGETKSGAMWIRSVTPKNGETDMEAVGMPPTALSPHSKSWENVTLAEVAKEIAARHALTFEAYNADAPQRGYISQNNEPDFVFLQKYCDLEHAAFVVFDKRLIVYRPEKEANVELKDLRLEEKSKDTGLLVKTVIVNNGKFTGRHDTELDHGTIENRLIRWHFDDQAHANDAAKAIAEKFNRSTALETYVLPLRLDCAACGVASVEGELYFIAESEHDFGEFLTTLKLRRM